MLYFIEPTGGAINNNRIKVWRRRDSLACIRTRIRLPSGRGSTGSCLGTPCRCAVGSSRRAARGSSADTGWAGSRTPCRKRFIESEKRNSEQHFSGTGKQFTNPTGSVATFLFLSKKKKPLSAKRNQAAYYSISVTFF